MAMPKSDIKTKKKNPSKPGWKSIMGDVANDNNFWHSVWKSEGSPNQGNVYNRMKSAKSAYRK